MILDKVHVSAGLIPRVARNRESYMGGTAPRGGTTGGTAPAPAGEEYWWAVDGGEEREEILYLEAKNSVLLDKEGAFVQLEDKRLASDGDRLVMSREADEEGTQAVPWELVMGSMGVKDHVAQELSLHPEVIRVTGTDVTLLEVKQAVVRMLGISEAVPTLAFYRGRPWPLPGVPDFGLMMTSGTHLDSVPGTGQGTFIWEMHHKLEVRENGFFEKELEVGGQLTCSDRAVIQKDLTVMGNILSPLATGTKKGVVSVNITGSGDFLMDASIANGVLTLVRRTPTLAQLIAIIKAAGYSCTQVIQGMGCSCAEAVKGAGCSCAGAYGALGCSCSSVGCYSSCSSCCSCPRCDSCCGCSDCNCSSCCNTEEERAALRGRFAAIPGFTEAWDAWMAELGAEEAVKQEIREAQEASADGQVGPEVLAKAGECRHHQGGEGESESGGEKRGTKGCTNKEEDANVLFEVMRRKIEALEERIMELEARTN